MQRDQLVVLPQLPEWREAGREPEDLVELDEVRRLERQRTAQRLILRVAVRNDRGKPSNPPRSRTKTRRPLWRTCANVTRGHANVAIPP